MSQITVPIPFDWTHIASGTPYSPAAFSFVQNGLGYTTELCNVQTHEFELDEFDRHVSGQQLCMGLRDYAIDCFGLLAPVVLRHWGINRTEDFGAIVFRMVEFELLRTSQHDSEEDFRSVFQFDDAFHSGELIDCIGSNQ
jgi:uncharacterized repeat protein (TIGR04138 family)|tara:strand:- start:806 stop:1225 length:420 start_codon:yes stop_codon:yes gene_type:complete